MGKQDKETYLKKEKITIRLSLKNNAKNDCKHFE
jgi:hypothetical protein